jgi:glycerol kinase
MHTAIARRLAQGPADNRGLASGEKREFALEGSVFIAGAAVQWLRDGLGIIKFSGDVDRLAASVADNASTWYRLSPGSGRRTGIPTPVEPCSA